MPTISDKLEAILNALAAGQSRTEVAKQYQYKSPKSLDMYMRRKGYRWNAKDQHYQPQEAVTPTRTTQETPSRIARILTLLAQGLTVTDVAKQMGFPHHREMATYLRQHGYTWSRTQQTYCKTLEDAATVPASMEATPKVVAAVTSLTSDQLERVYPALEWLVHHHAQLQQLVSGRDLSQLPRYAVPGIVATKSVHISHLLDQLAKQFSIEKNVSQRDVFEIALIEFFQKYGYSAEMKKMLG